MANLLRRLASGLISFQSSDPRSAAARRGPFAETLEYDLHYYDAVAQSLMGRGFSARVEPREARGGGEGLADGLRAAREPSYASSWIANAAPELFAKPRVPA